MCTPTLASVYFPGILRAVQVGVHEYLHQVGTNVEPSHAHVDVPDYKTSLVWDLRRGTFQNSSNWLPIPEGYLTPRAVTGGTRTAATSSTGDTPRTVVARIENPGPDADFTNMTGRPGGFRPVLQTRAPPTNDAGTEFCVAWWLRGACSPTVEGESPMFRSRLQRNEHGCSPSAASYSRHLRLGGPDGDAKVRQRCHLPARLTHLGFSQPLPGTKGTPPRTAHRLRAAHGSVSDRQFRKQISVGDSGNFPATGMENVCGGSSGRVEFVYRGFATAS